MHQKTLNRLPLVPLSPWIQISRDYTQSLAHTTNLLSSDSTLPTLKKDFAEQSERLEELKSNMQSVQCALLTDLNMYDIAKEIAYINCSLFRMVKLDDERKLADFDQQSNMIPLLDFHHYLSHSFAHLLIYDTPRKDSSMVAQLIQIAYILLHIYRDFSGCTAVMTCLHMPQVQRLLSWQQVPSKLVDIYKELVAMISPHNDYEAYHHQLWLHTSQFLDINPNKSQMIAVPFMQAHLDKIRKLVNTERLSSPFVKNNTIEVILSEQSQQSIRSVIQIARFCQQHAALDASELERYAMPVTGYRRRLSFQSNYSRRSSFKASQSMRLEIPPCHELDLLKSNHRIYHWLVSRAYLTSIQLHSESVCVKPLEPNEPDRITEDTNDVYWEFFRQETIACVNLGTEQQTNTETVVDALDVHAPSTRSIRASIESQTIKTDANLKAHSIPSQTKTAEAEAKPDPVVCTKDEEIPKSTAKPILSPTAPEFVPQTQPVKRYNDDDDDDVIILTEEDNEEEEEWTGYPSSRLTEDEDEEWTGYPISSQDEEDEDEIWRGYPMPQEEHPPLSSPTSPFTPNEDLNHLTPITEEWRGYQKTLEESNQRSSLCYP